MEVGGRETQFLEISQLPTDQKTEGRGKYFKNGQDVMLFTFKMSGTVTFNATQLLDGEDSDNHFNLTAVKLGEHSVQIVMTFLEHPDFQATFVNTSKISKKVERVKKTLSKGSSWRKFRNKFNKRRAKRVMKPRFSTVSEVSEEALIELVSDSDSNSQAPSNKMIPRSSIIHLF
jgi:hypothetical protein